MNKLQHLQYLGRLGNQGKVAITDSTDSDARTYISAVETADGQALEPAVKAAINAFVVDCKADGIWDAIKSSAILAGARTLSGALVPLKGTAPTNFNFVSGDYNRKTGLVGNGSTKYLNSNRNNNVDPQNSRHLSVWVSTAATTTQYGADIGFYLANSGSNYLGRSDGLAQFGLSDVLSSGFSSAVTQFRGVARESSSTTVKYRASGTTNNISRTSIAPATGDILVFRGTPTSLQSNARLAFYSIGEALSLALLDARVTQLMTDLGNAIP